MLTTENYRPCLGLSVIGRGPRGTVRSPLGHLAGGGIGAASASYIGCLIALLALRPPFRPSFFILSFRRSDTLVRFVSFVACCVVWFVGFPRPTFFVHDWIRSSFSLRFFDSFGTGLLFFVCDLLIYDF
jgi:hypothetical protein